MCCHKYVQMSRRLQRSNLWDRWDIKAYLPFSHPQYCFPIISSFAGSSGLSNDRYTCEEKPVFQITFGAGSDAYSQAKPSDFSFSTTYEQLFQPKPNDGQFSIVNSVRPDREWDVWLNVPQDHTGDKNGYMYLVNGDYNPGRFYNGTITDLTVGQRYEFSVYLANPMAICGIKPNIVFEVRSTTADRTLLARLTTGDIPEDKTITWRKYGISFIASTTTVNLLMISNAPGGSGNDILIDDITLRGCSGSYRLIFIIGRGTESRGFEKVFVRWVVPIFDKPYNTTLSTYGWFSFRSLTL